ncbi:kinase-like domain-containing protein [Haematococcus lacustris]
MESAVSGDISSAKTLQASPSSMQRKLADMFGPLLSGSLGRGSPKVSTPSNTAPVTPRALEADADHPKGRAVPVISNDALLAKLQQQQQQQSITSMCQAGNHSTSTSDSCSLGKKASCDSSSSVSSGYSTVSATHDSTSSAASTVQMPGTPILAPPTPVHPSAPALITPHLTRLMECAKHCRLPPSPRVEPPAGAPPGTPNLTTPLVMSYTLPPSMQRQHWCVDDYTIMDKLYTGYASTVFKAQCKRSGEVVVLKIYTLASVCDLYKYQIYREVNVHAQLRHSNIVHLYAAFQEGDRVVMVQEYADGSDLFTLLHKYGGRLSERLAVQMVIEPFLRVMHYLHLKGFIHRDIKPENILFTKDMVLKLGDFGLAIDLREERAVTRAGTLDYMAPEVLRCPFKSRPEENKDNRSLHYGARVDSWAAGVLTYELLVGFPPFFDQSRTNTEERIVTKSPEYPPTVSEEAKAYISRALHKSPAERPTILEMLSHSWVEQYRVRRSMRAVPAAAVAAPVAAQPAVQPAAVQPAAQPAAAPPAMLNSAHCATTPAVPPANHPSAAALAAAKAQMAKTRQVATLTNFTTGAHLAANVMQKTPAQHLADTMSFHKALGAHAVAYPMPMTNILNSISCNDPPASLSKAQSHATPLAIPSQVPRPLQQGTQPAYAPSPLQTAQSMPRSESDSADAKVYMNLSSGAVGSKAQATPVVGRAVPALPLQRLQ